MNRTQILDGPALAPPPGLQSNFDHPFNDNRLVHGVTIVCLFFTTVAVTLRAYSAFFLVRRLTADNVLVFAGFGVYLGYVYCLYRLVYGVGFSVHQWDIRVRDFIEFAYVKFVGSVLYAVVIACVKAAILLEWNRIFVPSPARNAFYYASWTIIVLNTVFYTLSITLNAIACHPYEYIWDKTIPGGYCTFPNQLVDLTSAVINLVSDLAILILPQQVIWRLRMSARNKIGLSITFAIGIFGCVAAAVRITVTLKYAETTDFTHELSPVALWGLGEMTTAFVIACVSAAPRVFAGDGFVARITNRVTSFIGLSKRKPSPSNLPRAWARDDGSRRKAYQGLYDNDTLFLTTVATTAQNIQPSADTLGHPHEPHATRSPHIVRMTDIRLEETFEDNNRISKLGKDLHVQLHPWERNHQED
ncbi:hypothetical protein GGS20DRAFT_208183 [Poronia punctata]|nr:hypothetical protein GGS20DRAFT_208183 [Poronia punctata]